jgi:RNA polymerase sigma factor (sigma-70 family)
MAVTTSYEDAGDTTEVRSAEAAEALLLDVVHRHADELLRVARTHSLCADDANDAYQRSLEHFLRSGRRLRHETADRWLFTVVKREAQAVRRARGELVGTDEVSLERLDARHDATPEDHALAADAVTRSAEALRSLKPQEIRALWLRADGRSYAEIQQATGWSYTKVNRCLTEGRRAFLARCAELEAGAECARWHGVLAALAGGEAGAEDLAALRPHLRRCAACKATLRALHASSASVATILPPGLVGVGAAEGHGGAERLEAAGRWLARLYAEIAGPVQERAATSAWKWHAAVEAAAGGKVAAVAASTVALAGGGAVAAHDAAGPARPAARRAATTTAGARGAAPTTVKRQPAHGAAVAGVRPAAIAPEHGSVRSRAVAAPHSAGVRAKARSAGADSSGGREFGVDPGSPAVAAVDLAETSQRRGTSAGARAGTRRSDTAVAPPSAIPAGTDFTRAAPSASTASRPASTRPDTAAPSVVSEFGP